MILLSLLILPLSAFAIDAASLPDSFQEANGKTFAHLGPNCFAAALKLTDITQSYRGMDEPEFREITKLYCERTEEPKVGDIGVFEKPGYGFIHAYAYVSPEYGMEKPGVDYMGQTPIAFASMDSIQYRYLASPECRRYSGSDISSCSNQHYYLSCEPVHFSGNLNLESHHLKIREIEKGLDFLLEQSTVAAEDTDLFKKLELKTAQMHTELSSLPAGRYKDFLSAQMVSLQKQLEFMQPKFRSAAR